MAIVLVAPNTSNFSNVTFRVPELEAVSIGNFISGLLNNPNPNQAWNTFQAEMMKGEPVRDGRGEIIYGEDGEETYVEGKESFYDGAKKQFRKMFNSNAISVSEEEVRNAAAGLYVDGVPYAEKYGIQVNAGNWQIVLCHMVHNLTRGEIAQSYSTDKPMQTIAISFDASMREPAEAVVPAPPQDPEKKVIYDRNLSVVEESANRVREHIKVGVEPNIQRVRDAQRVFADKDIKQKLQNNVLKIFKQHSVDEATVANAMKTEFFGDFAKNYTSIHDVNTRYTTHPYLSGVGREGSIRSDLFAFMMAYGNGGNGRSLDDVMSMCLDEERKKDPEVIREKKELGEKFFKLFYVDKTGDPETGKKDFENASDKELDEAIARMFKAYARERMRPMDVLNPDDVEKHGLHNLVVGQMAMDLGQIVTGKGAKYQNIERMVDSIKKEGTPIPDAFISHCDATGESLFARIKEGTTVFKNLGQPMENLFKLYTTEGFLNGTLSENSFIYDGETMQHIEQIPLSIAYDQLNQPFLDRSLYDFKKDEVSVGMTLATIGHDRDKKIIARFMNGKDVSLQNASNANGFDKAAALSNVQKLPNPKMLFTPPLAAPQPRTPVLPRDFRDSLFRPDWSKDEVKNNALAAYERMFGELNSELDIFSKDEAFENAGFTSTSQLYYIDGKHIDTYLREKGITVNEENRRIQIVRTATEASEHLDVAVIGTKVVNGYEEMAPYVRSVQPNLDAFKGKERFYERSQSTLAARLAANDPGKAKREAGIASDLGGKVLAGVRKKNSPLQINKENLDRYLAANALSQFTGLSRDYLDSSTGIITKPLDQIPEELRDSFQKYSAIRNKGNLSPEMTRGFLGGFMSLSTLVLMDKYPDVRFADINDPTKFIEEKKEIGNMVMEAFSAVGDGSATDKLGTLIATAAKTFSQLDWRKEILYGLGVNGEDLNMSPEEVEKILADPKNRAKAAPILAGLSTLSIGAAQGLYRPLSKGAVQTLRISENSPQIADDSLSARIQETVESSMEPGQLKRYSDTVAKSARQGNAIGKDALNFVRSYYMPSFSSGQILQTAAQTEFDLRVLAYYGKPADVPEDVIELSADIGRKGLEAGSSLTENNNAALTVARNNGVLPNEVRQAMDAGMQRLRQQASRTALTQTVEAGQPKAGAENIQQENPTRRKTNIANLSNEELAQRQKNGELKETRPGRNRSNSIRVTQGERNQFNQTHDPVKRGDPMKK